MNSVSYRKTLIAACHLKNEKKIRGQAEGKVKCTKIVQEKYGKKDYVQNKKITIVRQTFKSRFMLYPQSERR